MALSAEQRGALWRARLRRLARDGLGRPDGADHAVPWGAALEHDGIWTALLEVSPLRSFGQALVLAAGNDARGLDLLVEHDAGGVARRAALFRRPPTVWRIDGSALHPATPAPLELLDAPPLTPGVAALLAIDGVEIVVEAGEIVAECRGLEVARVRGAGHDQRLDVGVGAYDQGAFSVMHPELTPVESLADVVGQVRRHRSPGAPPHPINRLARERWIRHELLGDPGRLGLASLEPVEAPTPRAGLTDTVAASALGTESGGRRVLVTCSVGIDLDAVPAAVDLAALHRADRIVLVLPERDQHRLVRAVAELPLVPVEIVSADEPWNR